ncbi:unnamed protein product [Closterium sp. NIES-54]
MPRAPAKGKQVVEEIIVKDVPGVTLPSPDASAGVNSGAGDASTQPVWSVAGAGSSGLTPAEKATTKAQLSSDGFLEEDSDEELDIDIQQEVAAHLRFTAILLVPFMLQQELGAVINTVQTLLRKVRSSSLSAGVAEATTIQTRPATFVAKQHFCRLQISFLQEEDAVSVRSNVAEYQCPRGKVTLFWQHTENPAYLKEKASNPHVIKLYFKDVPANVSPELLKDILCRYPLKIRQVPTFAKGHCFHRVLHPVFRADTDTVKGLSVSSDSIDNSSSNNTDSSRDNSSHSSNIDRSSNNSTSTNRQFFINTVTRSTADSRSTRHPQKC